MSLQTAADRGFAKADVYDQHRPAYPASAVQDLLDKLNLTGRHGAKILDLGAGTGKFTQVLAARDEKYNILAVEPQKDMRLQLEAKNLPNTQVKPGLSYDLPVEQDAVFDAVIAAQSFHWYADEKSLDEIHRVLKSAGGLGMIWNIDDYNQTRDFNVATPWQSQLRDLTWTFDDDVPRYRHDKWRSVFDSQLNLLPAVLVGGRNSEFTLPIGREPDKHEWFNELTEDELWSRYSTLSQIAVLEGEDLQKVRDTFDSVVSGPDVERTESGKLKVHGVTSIAWTTKVFDGAPLDSEKDMDGLKPELSERRA